MAVDEINAAGGILGKKIRLEFVDTASDPGKARAAMQRALDDKPIAIFGPIYSGSVSATLKLTADAEVPQIIGGEAGPLTAQGSKYIFRTSFGQNVSMPKIANYLRDEREGQDAWRSSTSTTTSARAAAMPSSRSWRARHQGAWPTSRPRPARPTSPPT